jgi:hypothetical protein
MLDKYIIFLNYKYNMGYVCPLCTIDPSNHSLVKLRETDNTVIFYSCPSQAKLYFDCEGIINHYDGILSEIPKNKKWVWVFDSFGFNFNHFMQINVGIQLTKLITHKFSDNLLNIIIINPTIYISLTYKTLKYFLSNRINEVIIFDNNHTSLDNVLTIFDSKNINRIYE